MARSRKLTKDQKRKKTLAARAKKERTAAAKVVAKREAARRLAADIERFRNRIQMMWTPDKVRQMSTEAIFEKLAEPGVKFNAAEFADAVRRHYSSDRVYSELWEETTEHVEGYDADFPRSAAGVLWERLHPDIPNEFEIDDQIDLGYDVQPQDLESTQDADWADSFEHWSRAWNLMQSRIPENVRSEKQLNQIHGGSYFVSAWLEDFGVKLEQVAGDTRARQLMKFCDQICERLPESDADYLQPFRDRRAGVRQRSSSFNETVVDDAASGSRAPQQ